MSTSPSLTVLAELVPFLRSRRGLPDASAGDLRAADLIADPSAFAEVVLLTGAGRGTSDPQIVASLWWQSYAYRTAGTSLAAWVVGGSCPDPGIPSGIGVGTSRDRPSSLLVGPGAPELTSLSSIVERLVEDHLLPLGDALRSHIVVGRQLLDGNAVAAIASCLGAVAYAPSAPPTLGPRIDEVMAALPDRIGRLGRWTQPHRAFRRRTCCLWWKTEAAAGALCEDCSLTGREVLP